MKARKALPSKGIKKKRLAVKKERYTINVESKAYSLVRFEKTDSDRVRGAHITAPKL